MEWADRHPHLSCPVAAFVPPVLLGPDEQLALLQLWRLGRALPIAAMWLQDPVVEAGSSERP